MSVLLVVVGAAFGAPTRHLVSRRFRAPWGIVVVNLIGCLALGILLGSDPPTWLTTLAGAGFCGALTTFSTFALDAVEMAEAGAWRTAVAHLVLSVAGGLALFSLGWWALSSL
ncbi:fluoride efflux transporter CrcB [soil metagenome]